jgi:hypothetical protein
MYTKGMEIKAIVATFAKAKRNRQPFASSARFDAALQTLAAGKTAGEIWNVEFNDAKYYISHACEHAQEEAAHEAHDWQPEGGIVHYDDARRDIGYAFGMNQAAKLSRNLKKLSADKMTPRIEAYIAVLDEIAAMFVYLQSFKSIIKKGRRPVQKTEEQLRDETFNTGVCAICANRQKLDGSVNMVMHGYQMSEYNHAGYRVGKCFGVGYKPYELSNEANVAFAPVLEHHRQSTAAAIKTWKSGKITSVEVKREKWEAHRRVEYKVTLTLAENPVEFQSEVNARIGRLENELRYIKADIKTNNAKIEGWTLQPLTYGSKAAI